MTTLNVYSLLIEVSTSGLAGERPSERTGEGSAARSETEVEFAGARLMGA